MNTQMREKNEMQVVISNNYFTFDHLKRQIVGTEHHFKLAGKAYTPQYAELMGLIELHPTYNFKAIPPKKKVEKKQTYAGLNKVLVQQWVDFQGTDDQKASYQKMVADK